MQITRTWRKLINYRWDEASKRTSEPYALKEFKTRWYVLAKDNGDSNIKSFALDRLTNLEITNKLA